MSGLYNTQKMYGTSRHYVNVYTCMYVHLYMVSKCLYVCTSVYGQ
jgi:hypothetical protein